MSEPIYIAKESTSQDILNTMALQTNLLDIQTKIGATTDTSGTATTGTVMGKLNALMSNDQKFLSRKTITATLGTTTTTVTIEGAGLFYAIGINTPISTDSITINIDGKTYTNTAGLNEAMMVWIGKEVISGAVVLVRSTSVSVYQDSAPSSTIEFNNKLTITYSSASSKSIMIFYALYE